MCAALAADEPKVLNIYNWGNYTSPEVIKKFEEKYNVKVTITDYDSNDTALAKVRAGGHGFDIVVPSANFMPIWTHTYDADASAPMIIAALQIGGPYGGQVPKASPSRQRVFVCTPATAAADPQLDPPG